MSLENSGIIKRYFRQVDPERQSIEPGHSLRHWCLSLLGILSPLLEAIAGHPRLADHDPSPGLVVHFPGSDHQLAQRLELASSIRPKKAHFAHLWPGWNLVGCKLVDLYLGGQFRICSRNQPGVLHQPVG